MKTNRVLKSGTTLGLLCLGLTAWAFAEAPVKYSQVEFDLSAVSMQTLGDLGLPVDHHDADGRTLSMPVSQYDLELLKAQKIPYKLLIGDYAKFIEVRNLEAAKTAAPQAPMAMPPPVNFKHGSMGGMLTLAELEKEMDELKRLYPALVGAKIRIGTSGENRAINAIRISNNPAVDQDKPKVFYNALTHAREPMGMMNLFYYAWYLLENYATDPDAKKIVDNLELYFVFCVNPDGYEYDRSTNPSGGGLWRKNRASNSDGSRGVDINRNFSVMWGNNAGSSGTGSSDAYRGPSAFSEPETKALRDFHLAKKFFIMLTYHTFSNKVIHPYGEGSYPTNRADYERIAKDLTRLNGWQYGTVPLMVGYSATGVETDWAHDVGKEYAFGAELGASTDGFWPPVTRIDPLAALVLETNLALARAALPPVVRLSMPGRKIAPSFYADVNTAGGVWNFNYQLADSKHTWYLTVHDMRGKEYRRHTLPPSGTSIALSRDGLPGSLFVLDVKKCDGEACTSVYKQKLVRGGF